MILRKLTNVFSVFRSKIIFLFFPCNCLDICTARRKIFFPLWGNTGGAARDFFFPSVFFRSGVCATFVFAGLKSRIFGESWKTVIRESITTSTFFFFLLEKINLFWTFFGRPIFSKDFLVSRIRGRGRRRNRNQDRRRNLWKNSKSRPKSDSNFAFWTKIWFPD